MPSMRMRTKASLSLGLDVKVGGPLLKGVIEEIPDCLNDRLIRRVDLVDSLDAVQGLQVA